jgi:hypothetical protein
MQRLIPSADLDTVNAAITILCEYSEQDRAQVCDMASAMLTDLSAHGALAPLGSYVGLYCTVAEGGAEVDAIAARIMGGVHVDLPGRPS